MLRTQDLADVVYASGAVFNGLSTNRPDTRSFLATGSTAGVSSRSDLNLLEDLRDAAEFIVRHASATVDAAYVIAVNARLSRSGALLPGVLMADADHIGVATRYGRHEPPALTVDTLRRLIDQTVVAGRDDVDNAIALFVAVAAAQPFGDGNKRTALFAANGLLIAKRTGRLLTLPAGDEHDPLGSTPGDVSRFNDLLARAYVLGETGAVEAFLRDYVVASPGSPPAGPVSDAGQEAG